MNYTAKQFHLHYISQYTLIVKANYEYDMLYVLDAEGQILVYMKFESMEPSEEALKLLSLPFQQVFVSVPSQNLTFIPQDLYQEEDLDAYRDFMENPSAAIETEHLDFLQIQALYQYDVLLSHRWKTLFPSAVFIPEFKLNLLQARPYIPLKGEVVGVVFNNSTTDIFLFVNGQFKFYNTFEILSDDDLSYFILNVFDNFQLKDKVTKALVSGVDLEDSVLRKLDNYAHELVYIKASHPAKANEALEEEVSSLYLLDLPTCAS
ncbi:DUF3822 family protein [Sphingobacterium lactis]|uniref:DUF3822 family protein n=1 Tax=Sphingobacterium lactis TaxID=797291 RepID=A0A1H5Z243_9SPHI|nr:DUF3822 family protein [Sphingobacterium lactis]SEG30679.1 Protein of unknown function [Sphingobacterium lactis]